MSTKRLLPILVLLVTLCLAQATVAQSLFNAIRKNDIALIKQLLAADASIANKKGQGELPLVLAAQVKRKELVKLLLENGADVNAKTTNGYSVLHEVMRRRSSDDIVSLVLDAKPDMNATGPQGQTALMIALQRNTSTETIKRLVEQGADPAQTNQYGQSARTIAIQNRRVGNVFELLFENADLNSVDAQGNTLLMNACQFRNEDIASKLIDRSVAKKIDIETRNKSLQTALHLACQSGSNKVIEKLLAAGADVNSLDASKNTPFVLSIYSNNIKTTKLLIEQGADVKQLNDASANVFAYIVSSNNTKMLELLFESGLKAGEIGSAKQFSMFAAAINKYYPRQRAANNWPELEMLKLLCEKGLDPNVAGDSGPTQGKLPIDLAIIKRFVRAVDYLAEKADLTKSKSNPEFLFDWACRNGAAKLATKVLKIQPDLANSMLSGDRGPLLIAAESGYADLVENLLANNVNVNAKDKDGNAPLMLAAAGGHGKTVLALIKAGAEVDAADNTGQSALHLACWSSSKVAVTALLDAGANINAPTNTKKTPLHVAAWEGVAEHVKAILNATSGRANIDAQDTDGWTPLHKAAFRGHSSVVRELVEKGADKNLTTKAGMTAGQLAAGKKHEKVVELLNQ